MRKYTVPYFLGIALAVYPVISNALAGGNAKLLDTTSSRSGMNRALESQIDQYLAQKKYKESLAKLQEELKKDPNSVALLNKMAEIYINTEEYYKAQSTLDKAQAIEPNNKAAVKLRKVVDENIKKMHHNEIGYFQDEAYLNDLQGYWTVASLHYYKLTAKGSFGGRINYANRYNMSAGQYLVEGFPQLGENVSASLSVGYANTSQILFPNFQYRAEPYFSLPHGVEVSLGHGGQKYITFENQWLYSYTASLGKYLDNYYVWYRPVYWAPTQTTFSEVGVRRYFSNKFNYIALKINNGRLPDIGDLPPFDQLVILHQTGANLDGGFSISKNCFIKAGIGYASQTYVKSGHLRNITDVLLGIDYRFS